MAFDHAGTTHYGERFGMADFARLLQTRIFVSAQL
jgi:hypothetical protein